ncbi:5674_t:CDS:2, partial [Funneliformis geosporum]
MDAFANKSTLAFLKTYRGEDIRIIDNRYQPRVGETVEILYDPNSEAEAMRIGYEFLRQGKRVAFVSTGAVMARALVEKASKLSKLDNSPVRARAYYGDMDGKQRQKDFSDINVAWSKLDCIAYTNTVEVGISFEVTGHFDIVIAITNIATPVHVEALVQMLYRIHDCPCPELANAQPNNLPTSIKGHYEWDSNAVSYKIDESPAVITFIEVEHQKRLSARYFIEKLCSLIASTGASLQLIKMDESRGVIGNHKKVRNERSIPDTMALKRFYMRNIYGKDMDDKIWDNLCNKKFVKHFSPPEPRKYFLRLSHFRKQGYDEESAMKGLEAKDIAQWEDTHYKAGYNSEKSVAEDLHNSYSANHWKVIQELFQILGFTGIDDKRTLSSDTASESFMWFCEKFIEIRNQSLLLFGFKSRVKETPDLHSAIKTINAIAGNWCGYTVESDKKRIGPKGQQ